MKIMVEGEKVLRFEAGMFANTMRISISTLNFKQHSIFAGSLVVYFIAE